MSYNVTATSETAQWSTFALRALMDPPWVPDIPCKKPSVPVSFYFARSQRKRRKLLSQLRGGKK
jgi:hypothetical protein